MTQPTLPPPLPSLEMLSTAMSALYHPVLSYQEANLTLIMFKPLFEAKILTDNDGKFIIG
jgi:hypothetical protein